MTKLLKIDTASRCITFSPDGKLLVVGFGDGSLHKGKIHQKEGTFSVLKSSDLKVVHEARDSSSYLRVLRFSPDGRILCCGSEDACIYMYNTKDSFSRRSTLRSHQAPIFAIDFSLDGKYIMSADLSKRVCFCESVSGNPILSVEKLRDEKWATISHPFNWSNLGFWMAQQEGVDICLAQKSSSGLLTAVGLRNGRTLVSHNPCPQKAGFLDCLGHTGNVAQLCWLAGDTGFISISTNDHSIMQWKCIYDHHIEDAEDGFLPGDISDQESVFGVYTREVTNLGTESTNKWMSNIAPPSSLEANPTLPPQANVYLEVSYIIDKSIK